MKRRFTLLELMLALASLEILVALCVPLKFYSIVPAKRAACRDNLSQLWRVQAIYRQHFGGHTRLYPPDTGGAFWLRLSRTAPPLIDPTLTDIYDCPLTPDQPAVGMCEYRGPASDVNAFADGDPVGADLVGSHGGGEGGSVLRKFGDVMNHSQRDPVWVAAASKTMP